MREGAKIRLFKARIIDPKHKYRKEIERYIKLGRIPSASRYYLQSRRQKLQISEDDALLIEKEVFAPVQKKKENLKKYEMAVKDFIAEEGSLDLDWIKDELERFQKELNLENIEVDAIKQKITEAQRQQKREEYQNNLQRYKQEFTKAIGSEYPLNDYIRDGLKKFQKFLGLTDKDVAQIERPIIQESEAIHQEKLQQQEEKKRRQEAERVKKFSPPTVTELESSNLAARDDIKKLVRTCNAETVLECPVCKTGVKAKNLLRHFDREHFGEKFQTDRIKKLSSPTVTKLEKSNVNVLDSMKTFLKDLWS